MVLSRKRTGLGLCFRKTSRGGRLEVGRVGRRLGQEPGQERMKARPEQGRAEGMEVNE